MQAFAMLRAVGRPHPWLHAIERAAVGFGPDDNGIPLRKGVGFFEESYTDVFLAAIGAESNKIAFKFGIDSITDFRLAEMAFGFKVFDCLQCPIRCMCEAFFGRNQEAIVLSFKSLVPW